MAAYQPGEHVDITIRGAVVVEVSADSVTFVAPDSDPHGDLYLPLPLPAAVTVERVAPAEWPPQPGDVWTADPGDQWGASVYFARDLSNLDNEPAGTLIRLVGASEYCDGTYAPDELARRYRLTLAYRPEPTPEVRGCPACGSEQNPHICPDAEGGVQR